jgi:hypothetical protein
MPTISQTQLDTIAALLPDEHLTLAEIAKLAGVNRETVLAFMDGNELPGNSVVTSSPLVTPLAKPVVTTPSWSDNPMRRWRSEPRRSLVGEPRPRLLKPRYLPTRAEIRQACLRLHERGKARAEDLERPAFELPVASAALFEV